MSNTQQRLGRSGAAVAVSIVAGPVMVWAGLICLLTITQQVISGFLDVSQGSWTQVFNPAFWLGWQSFGGTGGVLDALVGGPGAPGGTVSRYFTFMLFGLITAACFGAINASWNWARNSSQ